MVSPISLDFIINIFSGLIDYIHLGLAITELYP